VTKPEDEALTFILIKCTQPPSPLRFRN